MTTTSKSIYRGYRFPAEVIEQGFGARMPTSGTLALQASSTDKDRHRPCQRHVAVGNLDVNGHLVLPGAEGSGGEAPDVDAFDAGDGRLDQ
jgi:hypothetical protein